VHYALGRLWCRTLDDLTDPRLLAQCHHGVLGGGKLRHGLQSWLRVTKGRPLLAKLFNILVNAIVWEWIQKLWEDGDYKEEEPAEFIATFFAIFYINNVYLASWDAVFLQRTLTLLVHLVERIGIQTNTLKTQTIICTPGQIRTARYPFQHAYEYAILSSACTSMRSFPARVRVRVRTGLSNLGMEFLNRNTPSYLAGTLKRYARVEGVSNMPKRREYGPEIRSRFGVGVRSFL
jgi:hypothetical protein